MTVQCVNPTKVASHQKFWWMVIVIDVLRTGEYQVATLTYSQTPDSTSVYERYENLYDRSFIVDKLI